MTLNNRVYDLLGRLAQPLDNVPFGAVAGFMVVAVLGLTSLALAQWISWPSTLTVHSENVATAVWAISILAVVISGGLQTQLRADYVTSRVVFATVVCVLLLFDGTVMLWFTVYPTGVNLGGYAGALSADGIVAFLAAISLRETATEIKYPVPRQRQDRRRLRAMFSVIVVVVVIGGFVQLSAIDHGLATQNTTNLPDLYAPITTLPVTSSTAGGI